MALTFEWDHRKAAVNFSKHGLAFEEAATVFADALSLTIADLEHSRSEHRFVIVGRSHRQRMLVVVHTERGDNIRIISARLASRKERRTYEEGV